MQTKYPEAAPLYHVAALSAVNNLATCLVNTEAEPGEDVVRLMRQAVDAAKQRVGSEQHHSLVVALLNTMSWVALCQVRQGAGLLMGGWLGCMGVGAAALPPKF